VDGLFGGACLGVSRSSGLQAVGDAAEQTSLRASSGEGDAHTRGGLSDAGGDLEQPRAQRGELGKCKRLGFWNGVADCQHQPVGGSVENETHLISECRTATGAVGGELALVLVWTAPDGINCARMRSLVISDKGGRP
jgi:hypothetical protein